MAVNAGVVGANEIEFGGIYDIRPSNPDFVPL
jgi:hypothetical protein